MTGSSSTRLYHSSPMASHTAAGLAWPQCEGLHGLDHSLSLAGKLGRWSQLACGRSGDVHISPKKRMSHSRALRGLSGWSGIVGLGIQKAWPCAYTGPVAGRRSGRIIASRARCFRVPCSGSVAVPASAAYLRCARWLRRFWSRLRFLRSDSPGQSSWAVSTSGTRAILARPRRGRRAQVDDTL
jgi:hypothetical protein